MEKISADQLRAIGNMKRHVKRITPRIEERFRDEGKKADPWHVFVVAGLWGCLDRLAKNSHYEGKKRSKNQIRKCA
jgi:hypothetical protein